VAVSFSPNSNFLVTGSEDGTAKIWDVSLTPGDATKYMTSSSDELSKSAKERLATYGDDRKRELCFQYLNKECPRIR
jgi:WD40 repeat protein